MAKKVDTSGFDPDFIIGQTKPDNRANSQVIQPAEPALEDSPPEQENLPEQPKEKETPKRKRGGQAGYKETFLKRNEIKTRQCVYISYDVHAVITKLVRALVDAGNDISVGGYIDTVLNEHLQLHKEEINEVYRQRPDDLL
ncbi:hypothetical protein M2451_003417 [Dysgonomonas sp. PFB1-18]|uniref:DUF3408 domain-containing protein n=1 Tax=unclassified Dysgonomonas TaxID=2630389 RepID=UPI0013D6B256|nr:MULTISPECIES: DUF3408 domain-containing protein [unclassified Dysgonomonas]MDH6310664.1 hypothetical protein [Dysgonomonas sp. PF1-14]MDH6340515.1 hypothetical protein [Dysgonomonas sp. PF1-16]MDH6382077.1 hypothetical protein [Dysgonomonas sp. PFB1-18]MDH6399421.1 hypothetical protein [Dysgonomonas sp. PF1-23]NDW08266.1 DUF3408 domain-containing protein [Dysgonomonas sp. 520]